MESLIRNKGFKALLITQFLGAFNDNAFKLVISFFALSKMGERGGLYLALAGIVFIAPFLLFSTYAGYWADRASKRDIIIKCKIFEIVVMALGFGALWIGNIYYMFGVLFLMGVQSAFFSPAKYGIIPEVIPEEKISEGNGLLQLWSYAAIILGMVGGGMLFHKTYPNIHLASVLFLTVSLLGYISSLFITKVDSAGSERKFKWFFMSEIIGNVRMIHKDRTIFLSMLGLAFFGFLGGLFQPNVLLYAKNMVGLDEFHSSLLLVYLSVGIGVGGLFAGKLSGDKIELGLVPFGAIGLTVNSLLLGYVYHSTLVTSIVMFLLGLSAGFYLIPLSALLQQRSPADRRGQILSTNNFFSFFAILLGSSFIYLFRDVLGLNSSQIFICVSFLTLVGAGIICRLLPYALIRFIVWILTHTVYRIRVKGRVNVPEEGGALLVSNHISYIDAILMVVTIDRPIRFLVGQHYFDLKWLRPLMKLSGAIPVNYTDGPKAIVKSLQTASDAINNGELVCIFPEGQLTRTGNMLKFNRGMERIMKDTDSPIVPVHLDRVWGSIFSYERGKYFFKRPKSIPYPVTVSYGENLPAHSRTDVVRSRVQELSAEAFKYRLDERRTLPEMFWKTAKQYPKRMCVADSSGLKLNYAQAFSLSAIMGRSLQSDFEKQKCIGILLPPSVGGMIANTAVSLNNKVPVNINYTASKEALSSIIKQSSLSKIITSKKFLEKSGVETDCEYIFIDDRIKDISIIQKCLGFVMAFVVPVFLSRSWIFKNLKDVSMDSTATIMFTSGSTGEPKGVVLSHRNIMSNLEGLYQVFAVNDKDVIMGVLPFFHSFGFTATLWFPLVTGMGATYHYNPMDAKRIGVLVEQYQATILMSTPTFLTAYIRRCTKEQFQPLRIVVVGAEKLKEKVSQEFQNKFGIEPMEGYGCTELSPIVALNLPDYQVRKIIQKSQKPGKIGLPLPGVAVKIVNRDTGEDCISDEDGLLLVKGAGVMQEYLNRPDLTKAVIKEGWYQTGDVANMDNDGFLKITDRLSRFSKIAGEMVPHIKIEEEILVALNSSDTICAVTSIPDEKKGERLAVLYSIETNVEELIQSLKQSGLPNLWIPAADMFYRVEELPMLGSGKLDLAGIKKEALEIFESSEGKSHV